MKRIITRLGSAIDWIRKRALLPLAALGLVLVAASVSVPAWYFVRPSNPDEWVMLGDLVAKFCGLYILMGGFWLTARRIAAVERTAEAAMSNVRLAEQGQVTERFTRAIELLGSDTPRIRLGAIYSLERIARDSPEDDHSTIMEVLTAFVREPGPVDDAKGDGDAGNYATAVTADIQATLTVIGRRSGEQRSHETRPLDLQNTRLIRAKLIGADLRGADLHRANLSGADLITADLSDAILNNADLSGAKLIHAKLARAKLAQADLITADLSGADLYGAKLIGADLRGADLSGAKLSGADLRGANLHGAKLIGADLRGADLTGADLYGADLITARFSSTTKWPDGFDPAVAGATKVTDED